MFHRTLEGLNRTQEGRLCKIEKSNSRIRLEAGPPSKSDGLYWLYTNYTDAELCSAVSSQKRNSVPIDVIAAQHSNLKMICRRKVGDFRVVYNGIGGIGPKGYGGLRERILGELRGGQGTGSLAVCDTSLKDLARWRYSYILWSEIKHTEAIVYQHLGESLETMWRLHFGWPILCAR